MNIQPIRRFVSIIVLILSMIMLIITLTSPTLVKACDIKARMIAVQQQAQQRRLNETNARLQWLQLLNDLQRGCVENFPEQPTQWLANSAALTTAFNKIKQSFCRALAAKARKTSEQALYAARATAQQQIDQINRKAITDLDSNASTNANSHNSHNSLNSLNSLIKQYPSPSSTNIQKSDPGSAGVTGIIKRLFQ